MSRIPGSVRISAPDPPNNITNTIQHTMQPSNNQQIQQPKKSSSSNSNTNTNSTSSLDNAQAHQSSSKDAPSHDIFPSTTQTKRPPARKAFKRRIRTHSTNQKSISNTTPKHSTPNLSNTNIQQPNTTTTAITTITANTKHSPLSKNLRWTAITLMKAMEECRMRTCSQVTEIVAKAAVADAPPTATASDKESVERNTRRRIYDALQVMTSIGCVQRDDKNLVWIGVDHLKDPSPRTKPPAPRSRRTKRASSNSNSNSTDQQPSKDESNDDNNQVTIDNSSEANEVREYRIDICKARKRVALKQEILRGIQGLVDTLRKNQGKNKVENSTKPQGGSAITKGLKRRVRFPFVLALTGTDRRVDLGNGRESLKITTSIPIHIFSDMEVLDALSDFRLHTSKKPRRSRFPKALPPVPQGKQTDGRGTSATKSNDSIDTKKRVKVPRKRKIEVKQEIQDSGDKNAKLESKPAKRARGRPRIRPIAAPIDAETGTNICSLSGSKSLPFPAIDIDAPDIRDTVPPINRTEIKLTNTNNCEQDVAMDIGCTSTELDDKLAPKVYDVLASFYDYTQGMQSKVEPQLGFGNAVTGNKAKTESQGTGDVTREQVDKNEKSESQEENPLQTELDANFAIDDSNENLILNLDEPLISASQLGFPPLPDVDGSASDAQENELFEWQTNANYDAYPRMFQNQ